MLDLPPHVDGHVRTENLSSGNSFHSLANIIDNLATIQSTQRDMLQALSTRLDKFEIQSQGFKAMELRRTHGDMLLQALSTRFDKFEMQFQAFKAMELRRAEIEKSLPATPQETSLHHSMLNTSESRSSEAQVTIQMPIQVSWLSSRLEEMQGRFDHASSRMDVIANTSASEFGRLTAEFARLHEVLGTSGVAEQAQSGALTEKSTCADESQNVPGPDSLSKQIVDRDRLMNESANVGTIAALIGGFALTVLPEIPHVDEAQTIGGIHIRWSVLCLFYAACHMCTFAALASAMLFSLSNRLSEQHAQALGEKAKVFHVPRIGLCIGTACYISGVVLMNVGSHLQEAAIWDTIFFVSFGVMCCMGFALLAIKTNVHE